MQNPTPARSATASTWVRCVALLVLLTASFTSFAQSIIGPDYVYVNTTKSPTGATASYGAIGAPGSPAPSPYAGSFAGALLGSYALGSSGVPDEPLLFQGGNVVTSEPTNANTSIRVKSVQLYYRMYLQAAGSSSVAFTALELPEDLNSLTTSGSNTMRTFTLNNATIDLIGAVSAGGTYTLEVYLQANYQNASGTLSPIRDDRSGTNYLASFVVTGSRQNTTIWNGGISDNWFDPANWSDGLPSATKDAFIRFPNPGATIPYPKIYANGPYIVSLTSGKDADGHTLDYSGALYGPAIVHSLSFGGSSATARATSELVTGNLLVYGDFTNNFDNFIQDDGTVVTFASPTAQGLLGGGGFKTVCIAGGGTKTLTGNMRIATELHFGPPADLPINANSAASLAGITNKGILAVSSTNNSNVVTLQKISGLIPTVAKISGETDAGFVSGLVSAQVETVLGSPQAFGNIGITLTFTGNSPGQVNVNRITNQYFQLVNKPNGFSIKRSFEVLPSDPQTADGGLNADLIFDYLEEDLKNVGNNNVTLNEDRFVLVYSNNSTSFTSLGATSLNTTANQLTRRGITAFGIFSLADESTLPVTLVAFDAKRLGDKAVVTWATAMERNNRGFDVEVSTDGTNFRTIGFVASNGGTSNSYQSYTYTDGEAAKSGVRYYRLHQFDYDGKDSYSPVRAVSFAAAGEVVAALSAYPNPFTSNEIKLALQSSEAGPATLLLTDLMGRQVGTQAFTAVKGVTEVSIDQATHLAAGSYLAQVTSPSGEVKTVRIQKK